jgi:hypothetical protein
MERRGIVAAKELPEVTKLSAFLNIPATSVSVKQSFFALKRVHYLLMLHTDSFI